MTVRDIIVRVLIAFACLVLVVLFLPQGNSETFIDNVKVNHPWYGRELVAPFDFPLLKSDEALQREKDSVRHNTPPYFRRSTDVKAQMMSAWNREMAKRKAEGGLPNSVASYVTACLEEVYDNGIVSDTAYKKRIEEPDVMTINIILGQESREVYVEDLYTPKKVYQHIVADADTALYGQQLLRSLNISEYIRPNLIYDAEKTNTVLDKHLSSILPASGLVMKDTRIVDKGEVVTEEIAQKIKSLKVAQENRSSTVSEDYTVVVGYVLYGAIVLLTFVFYLVMFRFDYVVSARHIWLAALLVALMPAATSILVRYSIFNIYVIPYAMIPIMARIFMDSRTSAMVMLTSVLLCAMPLNQPFDFLVIEVVAGFVAIYSLRDLSERSQLFRCVIYVTVVSLVTRLSLDLIHEGDFEVITWNYYMGIVWGGLLLLIVYPLLFVIERSFGFTSNVTLVELSNVNNPLLRRLSEEAPGTFQHVLQVANLSAEVANAIGGKSQLVRTGALYHDIGKLKHSAFFTENQRGVNPHDRLTPVQSARVILEHVSHGLELAEKHNLPKVIRDFIATHHGAGRVAYFYIKERENHPGEDVDPAPFTYLGPNPTTLEQAILMMTDAVEAASRSLREYTDETIAALVDKIVDGQVASGAFALCPITFRDIATAKKVFKEKLRTIYHTRISYPELK